MYTYSLERMGEMEKDKEKERESVVFFEGHRPSYERRLFMGGKDWDPLWGVTSSMMRSAA